MDSQNSPIGGGVFFYPNYDTACQKPNLYSFVTIHDEQHTTPQETIAASITKAASKQTYYTIRFLADRERVADAYRAYAYFRWVDDRLDAE